MFRLYICYVLPSLQSLVQVRKSEGLGIFAGARTVDVIDANTQVIAQTWSGSGAFGG